MPESKAEVARVRDPLPIIHRSGIVENMPTSAYHDFETPIGVLRLVGDERRLERIDLPNAAACAPAAAWRETRRALPAALAAAKRQLAEYFGGARRDFDLPLAPDGTPFQHRVWDELRRIAYGETISYSELASRIGRPTASRAVGAANGRNPLAIVVPCHRVIGADGTLTGYGGGLPVKQALLALERRVAGTGPRVLHTPRPAAGERQAASRKPPPAPAPAYRGRRKAMYSPE